MRVLIILLFSLPLFSCMEVKMDDLHAFVAEEKSKIYSLNDKAPALRKIDVLAYTGSNGRNPFSDPKAEVVTSAITIPKRCLQPNVKRKRQALERYSIDSLLMRGTFLINGELWALIQVADGEIYKVRAGYYLGLNHGKVLKITKDKIKLLALASGREGCWQERITEISLQSK